jgi:hypothetical protein
MNDLRYPIGRFVPTPDATAEQRTQWQQTLADFAGQLRAASDGLAADALATPYRPGGWTVAQVIHHCADSHINAYIRFKLALTEDNPTVKPYDEGAWAQLPDDSSADVVASLGLLEHLHRRWCTLLESMSDADFERTFFHPGYNRTSNLSQTLDLYQWHCRHHLAHVHLGIEAYQKQ